MFLFCDLAGSYTGEMSQNLSNVQKKQRKMKMKTGAEWGVSYMNVI